MQVKGLKFIYKSSEGTDEMPAKAEEKQAFFERNKMASDEWKPDRLKIVGRCTPRDPPGDLERLDLELDKLTMATARDHRKIPA